MKAKKRKNKKFILFIWVLLLQVSFLGFIYGSYYFLHICLEYQEVKNLYGDTASRYTEVTACEDCPIIVDFAELRKINEDIIGWIYMQDTVVNYPLLQGENNFYYLDKSYYKKYLASGSLYLDAANHRDFSDFYNIIYGHNMKNHTMFGDLDRYTDSDYLKNHRYIDILLMDDTWLRYEIEAAYRAKIEDGLYDIPKHCAPSSDSSNILLLSTCTEDSSDTERFVVQAALVQKKSF